MATPSAQWLKKSPKNRVQIGSTAVSIVYLPTNQAYAVLWHSQVLRVFNRFADAESYADEITLGKSQLAENPSAMVYYETGTLRDGTLKFHKKTFAKKTDAMRDAREKSSHGLHVAVMVKGIEVASFYNGQQVFPQSLQQNPGSALPWVIGGLALAGAAWWFMKSSNASAAPAAPPCPITDAMLTSYVKTKPTTYKLYVPPDTAQPVAKWPAPKADYVANKGAHTFSTVDCGFYKWDGTKWVSDEAENAALAKFVGASAPPALSGHPADLFMF